YNAKTINCSDDENYLLTSQHDKSTKLYRDAKTVAKKYEVWKDTYKQQIHDDLIFAADTVAYQIGVRPLRKKDLQEFNPDDKIINKFEEILRHNNVSDKENAFNRLIVLFICKLVDEINKSDDDIVEFQYKQGTDTYETLQDRLQRLHSEGMKNFMDEEIFYLSEDYPDELFARYNSKDRISAINELKNNIRKLKFYSNNAFAFKEVHNEKLFQQNGKILVEMVQLFEKYRIVYNSKHQFLGDLFEQLLNKGFKQNEGQFFTPMPITRFIWDSLPVENIIKVNKYPKVIDYACGAGHFLIEAIEAVNYFNALNNAEVEDESDKNSWVRDSIYGIEKDYRLARVAKISMFMNGAGGGNIIFGDGLENALDKGIRQNKFDILTSNPPYSVKDFKQHLELKNNEFNLLDKIGLNGGEIEVLFIERIAQLVKPKGIAAVILPSSILSSGKSYIGAREELLKHFYIRAIVTLADKTFQATGTNTVILFLEKFTDIYSDYYYSKDAVHCIYRGAKILHNFWGDKDILEAYTKQIGVSYDDYIKFIDKELYLNELVIVSDYFKMYVDAFNNSYEAKKFRNSPTYKAMSDDDQEEEYLKRFYDYAHVIERDKLLYFALTFGKRTLIINSPADKNLQKIFLGYDWSDRKGNEGIKMLTPGGKLYDDKDRTAEDTLAAAVRSTFNCDLFANVLLNDSQSEYAKFMKTCDMLDFSRVSFDKALRLNVESNSSEFWGKYKLIKLGDIASVQKGTAITSSDAVPGAYKVVAGGKDYAYTHNEYNRDENIITISASGSAGFVNYWSEKIFASDCTTVRGQDVTATKFIYYYLKSHQGQIYNLQKGANQQHVYPEDIANIPVPDVPQEIQRKIVLECDQVEEQRTSLSKLIETLKGEIENIFSELDELAVSGKKLSLADASKFNVSIGKRVLKSQLVQDGAIPVYSANVLEAFGYLDELLITDFSVPSILWGIDGDWMTNYMPEECKFYPTDHCGVLRCKTLDVSPRYMAHILNAEGKKIGFSRAHRASIDRVQGITFTVPNREVQDSKISQIEQLEAKIAHAEANLKILAGKCASILNNYLN
ncbi:MAG: N-6 DNA methylase, partial [Synergistaceae bacterium]|nr:N-6 DNA methylase [Synergistaceae bacterium]